MMPTHRHYIRPMLNVTKKEIVNYMMSSNFDWREDLSNQDTDYKRNAVRHKLVPVMAELAGSQEALYK
jgi:tRNA(Ile)-lysidine synthase